MIVTMASPVTIDQILVEFHDRDFVKAQPKSGEAIRKIIISNEYTYN